MSPMNPVASYLPKRRGSVVVQAPGVPVHTCDRCRRSYVKTCPCALVPELILRQLEQLKLPGVRAE